MLRTPVQKPQEPCLHAGDQKDQPAGCFLRQNRNLQALHEPANRKPEIIPHHDNALQPSAITVAQAHEFGVRFVSPGVQPLLELVQHQQHLLARFQVTASPQCRQ